MDSGTIEEGNSNFYIGDYVEIINGGPVCFVAGTYISTAAGEKLIETLEVGDMVLTADHGYQPIRWIGRKRFPALGNCAPVHFAPGAIGNTCHLELSPNHRVLVTGWRAELLFGEAEILVPAKFLINDTTIRYRKSGFVDYVHILFEAHEIVTTDNVRSESLLPSWGAPTEGTDIGQAELFSLFPEAFATQPKPYVLARRSLCNFEAQVFACDTSA
ncbi:Hint domain-containing protein [Yoonia sp. I 8.24]|uniref:Hint domain-containing protein n=1 Tax=Yoonia sp. I 8.24 TaxID=1537229 RepID=UPI001F865C24|nr:Hint domain-containing protein [Yoonia sp. I 8.24]